MTKYLGVGTQCYGENEEGKGRSGGGKNYYYNEKEREKWNGKSNHAILLELREFECQSFHAFLTWKEKDEEITTHFMHNQLGKSSTNGENW